MWTNFPKMGPSPGATGSSTQQYKKIQPSAHLGGQLEPGPRTFVTNTVMVTVTEEKAVPSVMTVTYEPRSPKWRFRRKKNSWYIRLLWHQVEN
jgi:hypothetical protein